MKYSAIIYIESPLQLLSASNYLSKNPKSVVIYRSSQPQLEKLVQMSSFASRSIKIVSIASIALIIRGVLRQNVQQLGFGDIRSTVSVLLNSIFRDADLLMFDDGAYSASVDDGGDPVFNSGYSRLKSKAIRRVFSTRHLSRHTILNQKISRSYAEVERSKLSDALRVFDTQNYFCGIPEIADSKIRKTFIYVESSLDGWTSLGTEKALYKRLGAYCDINQMQLLVVAHRLSTEERILSLMPAGSDAKVIKLGIPIEFLFLEYGASHVTFGFCFTSATLIALELISNVKLAVFKIDEELIFKNKKPIWASYFESLHDHSILNKNLEII